MFLHNIKEIAEGFQKKQGHFFFDQIFMILEDAYKEELRAAEEQLVQEIDEWVSDPQNAEYFEEDCYRLV